MPPVAEGKVPGPNMWMVTITCRTVLSNCRAEQNLKQRKPFKDTTSPLGLLPSLLIGFLKSTKM